MFVLIPVSAAADLDWEAMAASGVAATFFGGLVTAMLRGRRLQRALGAPAYSFARQWRRARRG